MVWAVDAEGNTVEVNIPHQGPPDGDWNKDVGYGPGVAQTEWNDQAGSYGKPVGYIKQIGVQSNGLPIYQDYDAEGNKTRGPRDFIPNTSHDNFLGSILGVGLLAFGGFALAPELFGAGAAAEGAAAGAAAEGVAAGSAAAAADTAAALNAGLAAGTDAFIPLAAADVGSLGAVASVEAPAVAASSSSLAQTLGQAVGIADPVPAKLAGQTLINTAVNGGDVGKALTNSLAGAGLSVVGSTAASAVNDLLKTADLPAGATSAISNAVGGAASGGLGAAVTGGNVGKGILGGVVGSAANSVGSEVAGNTGSSTLGGIASGLVTGKVNPVGIVGNAVSDLAKVQPATINPDTVGQDVAAGSADAAADTNYAFNYGNITNSDEDGFLSTPTGGTMSDYEYDPNIDTSSESTGYSQGSTGYTDAEVAAGSAAAAEDTNSAMYGGDWKINGDGVLVNSSGVPATDASSGFGAWFKNLTGVNLGGAVGSVAKFISDNKGLSQAILGGIGAAQAAKSARESAIEVQKLKDQSVLDLENQKYGHKLDENARTSASVTGLRAPGLDGIVGSRKLTRSDGSSVFAGNGIINRALA